MRPFFGTPSFGSLPCICCGAFGAWYLWAYFHASNRWRSRSCMFILVHLSISAGLHRLSSHKAVSRNKAARSCSLLSFSAAAFQASIIVWAYQHRMHHEHSDTNKDPYSVEHGFWWAHMGWIWRTKAEIDPDVPSKDLQRNKVLVWQDGFHLQLAILMSFCSAHVSCGRCYGMIPMADGLVAGFSAPCFSISLHLGDQFRRPIRTVFVIINQAERHGSVRGLPYQRWARTVMSAIISSRKITAPA